MALFDDASLVVTPNGYKAGTLYSIKPTSGAGDMTVVRATTATRVNSAGLIESVANNVPRLDYSNGTCPSILVEPQRTNLIRYSEQFDDALWQPASTTVNANQTTSPDGTQNADLIYPSSSGSNLGRYQNTSGVTGVVGTVSCYVKSAGKNWALLGTDNTSIYNVSFDLVNGVVGSVPTGYTATITSVGNGWYRITATFQVGYSLSYPFIGVADNTNRSVTADGTNGVYIWGFQVEAGSYPTSYIPTTSAAVTRNADVISKTGISALIGQTEGVVFFDAINLFPSGTRTLALLYTSGSAFYQIYLNSSNQVRVDVNGSFIFAGGTITSNTQFKIAFAYKSGDNALYINGTQIATSASTTIPSSLNDYYLGNSIGSEQSGSYGQAVLFPTRLTNAELATLTTI